MHGIVLLLAPAALRTNDSVIFTRPLPIRIQFRHQPPIVKVLLLDRCRVVPKQTWSKHDPLVGSELRSDVVCDELPIPYNLLR
jgi:hypothetical protein